MRSSINCGSLRLTDAENPLYSLWPVVCARRFVLEPIMQYPESTSVAVEQAWSKPGSLKPRGGHHLEPQGFKGLFVSGTVGHFIVRERGISPSCISPSCISPSCIAPSRIAPRCMAPPLLLSAVSAYRQASLATLKCGSPASASIGPGDLL